MVGTVERIKGTLEAFHVDGRRNRKADEGGLGGDTLMDYATLIGEGGIVSGRWW